MRNLRKFTVYDYNFQLGFYEQRPVWIIPELQIYVGITALPDGTFTKGALTDALTTIQTKAKNRLNKLTNENIDHPTPLKNLYKSTLPEESLLPISKVARALNLSHSCVRTLVDHKILPSIKTKGGHRKVRIIDVLTYKKTLQEKMNQPSPTPNPTSKQAQVSPPLLRISEAAEILNINQATLWRWQKQGKIQGIKIGNETRFSRTEIQNLALIKS